MSPSQTLTSHSSGGSSARIPVAVRAASAGADAVMAALEQARVDILLLAEDFAGPERDAAIELAIGQSAEILVARHHEDLVLHGGVGAVLRF